MKKTILCIGSAGRDIFFPLGGVRILNTPEDLTAKKHMMLELGAKYRTEDRYEAPGGCSLNVSLAMARLGILASSYSVVGSDTYGDEIVEELGREGVDTRRIVREKGVSTDVSCILVETKSADRTIIYNRDANERLVVDEKNLAGVSEIFVSGMYGAWKKNISVIAKTAKKKSVRVYYNPGQRNIAEDPARVARLMAVCEVVFLNKDEAVEMVLKMYPERASNFASNEKYLAKKIAEFGSKYVVITDGSRGAWVYNGESCYRAKSKKIDYVLDSTGAGDAFTGAFLAGYLKGRDMAECLRWGITNGGSVVQHYGARDGLLTEREMRARVKGLLVTVV